MVNCSCEHSNCNHELLKLFKKNLKYRKQASKEQLRKAGGNCVPCCQSGLIQNCDVSGCCSDFDYYALINRLGPLKPGDRRKICCCLRKQNEVLCPCSPELFEKAGLRPVSDLKASSRESSREFYKDVFGPQGVMKKKDLLCGEEAYYGGTKDLCLYGPFTAKGAEKFLKSDKIRDRSIPPGGRDCDIELDAVFVSNKFRCGFVMLADEGDGFGDLAWSGVSIQRKGKKFCLVGGTVNLKDDPVDPDWPVKKSDRCRKSWDPNLV